MAYTHADATSQVDVTEASTQWRDERQINLLIFAMTNLFLHFKSLEY